MVTNLVNDMPMENRTLEAVFRIESMADDITEIKGSMRDLATAVTKLALIEERQAHDRTDISRAFTNLDSHDTRIKTLEVAQPVQTLTSGWVQSALWIVIGGVMSAVLTMVIVAVPGGKISAPTVLIEKLTAKP